jgi:hypothetical protein
MSADTEHNTWIKTRDAAELLGLSYKGAWNVLRANDCMHRDGHSEPWRRADVLAIMELRSEQNTQRPISTYRGPDYCDADGARRLKAKIEAFWRERGGSVSVDLVEAAFTPIMRSARVDVRSDMKNGWPTEWVR